MNKNEAKKLINKTIKEYRTERDMYTYSHLGLESINTTYQLLAPNIATFPVEALAFISGAVLATYGSSELSHSLTDEIAKLKRLRSNLKEENFDNINEEVFEDCLIKRKTLL